MLDPSKIVTVIINLKNLMVNVRVNKREAMLELDTFPIEDGLMKFLHPGPKEK
jgi:hypothetical protein